MSDYNSGVKNHFKRYKDVFEHVSIGIGICGTDCYFLDVNEFLCRLTGYDREELLTMSFQQITHPDDFNNDLDNIKALIEGKINNYTLEKRYIRKDKSTIWVRLYVTLIPEEGIYPLSLIATIENITNYKFEEVTVRESKEKFLKIFDSAPVLISISEIKTGKFIEVNNYALKYSGFSREEVIGHTAIEIGWIDEPTRKQLVQLLNENGNIEGLELSLKSKNGKVLYGLLNAEKIIIKNKECFLLITTDITQRKEIENALEIKNIELIQAKEKAEESGRLKTAFLQNMSHEIRTPMNAIMGFSELIKKEYNNEKKLESYIEIIHKRCNDLLDIVNSILDIAKIESGSLQVNKKNCSLNLLFSELRVFFQEYQIRIGKGQINFRVQQSGYPDNLLFITDIVKLKQIFINLISNAFKFTDKGIIEIGLKYINQNYLEFYVSDTGIGIDPKFHTVIFDRFHQLEHSSERLYSGTGLGLSIVRGLVDLLGGNIRLESVPGEGTTFLFTIPNETDFAMHNVSQTPEFKRSISKS